MAAPFDGLIPASASAESSSQQLPYDVFINHHGGDVKDGLATTIYNKIDATGLRVFLDKYELKSWIFFPRALQEAMRTSSVHIAIFSQNYARSAWCLAELQYILQLPQIKFIPIFYHVEPSDLRRAIDGKGIYADAFSQYKVKGRYLELLQSWKSALRNASFFTGQIINNQSDEQKVVMNVVNCVLKELKEVRLDVARHPVGLDELQQDFHNEIALKSDAAGPTQIVGIWGMGGVGKTTLAKHLYNENLYNEKSSTIKRSSFVFDVREAARKELLHDKQQELLKHLNLESNDITNVEQGKGILRRRLKSISVLIVLDDVDHRDQLDALLPARDKLGQGSLIIITTRDFDVLKEWGISAVYKIPTLNPAYAHQLFCWHAFGQPSPLLGFEELAQKFIDACHGLPLSLEVLGSQLYGESSKAYWQSLLDKVSRIKPEDIQSRLRISYNALDKEEKEMFLDVACLFSRVTSSMAIAVWDGSGWNGLHGLQRLVNKCLVELEKVIFVTFIRMHDNLRDLGREIANRHSPYRLWSKQQIIKIRPQQEAIRVRGMVDAIGDNCNLSKGKIILETSQGKRILEPGSLGLKILFDRGDLINEQCSEISRELLFLCCYRFEHERFPSWLSLKNLRGLQLHKAHRLQDLWEPDVEVPSHLSELFIFKGYGLKKIESLESLRSLERLIMHDCTELNTLPSLAKLTSLKMFDLRHCNKLEKIEGLESLRSLEALIIYNCTELKTLPSVAEATSLKVLDLQGRNKLEKIESLETLRSLDTLIINDCTELNTLPSLAKITSLKMFVLKGCNKLKKIESLESLKSLETLIIYDCTELNTLPSLAEAISLKKFDLRHCNKLEKMGNLESLRSLETLIIYDCTELITLPSLAEETSLKAFSLRSCIKLEKIESLGGLRSLEILMIIGCMELNTLPSLADATSLKILEIRKCQKLDTIEGLEGLTSLKQVGVHTCSKRACMFSLEHSDTLEALEVVANDRSVIEPSISNIQKWQKEASANIVQKWQRKVIVCTRAVINVDKLKSFFTSFPLEDVVEYGSSGGLTLTMPESAANAILICFVIDYVHPNIRFCISTDKDNRFDTEMSNGKWLWMGIFPEGSNWLQAKRYQIRAFCGGKKVIVKKAWLLKGKEQSIVEAFHQLSQRKHELDACEKTCEEQLMAVQNDAAAASFNRPDTSVVQSLVPRNKRNLSPASGPNKRRKMIKDLGKDGGPRRSLRINKRNQTKEAK